MTSIGELNYKVRFDGRELSRGMLTSRQQTAAFKKIMEESKSPLDRYNDGLKNLEALTARYPQLAEHKERLHHKLITTYHEETRALQMLNKEQAIANMATGKQVAGKVLKTSHVEASAEYGSGAAASMMGTMPIAATGAAATAAVGYKTWNLLKASEAKYREVQTYENQLKVLTGSAQQAEFLMTKMRGISAKGVSFAGLAESAKTMMSFGVTTQDVIPMLRSFADISGGNSERMKSLALAYGQVTAAGRLMGQEQLQLVNAGFSPLQQISEKTGISFAELKSRMEDGQISTQMVRDAFISATAEGGRFYNMLESRSETAQGKVDKLNASMENMSVTIGEQMAPAMAQYRGFMNDIVKTTSEATGVIKQQNDAIGTFFASIRDTMSFATTGDTSFSNFWGFMDDREKQQRAKNAEKEKKAKEQELSDQRKKVKDLKEKRDKANKDLGQTKNPDIRNQLNLKNKEWADQIRVEEIRLKELERSAALDAGLKKPPGSNEAKKEPRPEVQKPTAAETMMAKEAQQQQMQQPQPLTQDQEEFQRRQKMFADQRAAEFEQRKRFAEQQMANPVIAAEQKKRELNAAYHSNKIDFATYNKEWNSLEAKAAQRAELANPSNPHRNVPTSATSMDAGSQEAARYLADLASSKQSKDNPNAKLEQQNDRALTEFKDMNKKLDRLADTSPRRVA